MSTRTKVLIAILLGILFFAAEQALSQERSPFGAPILTRAEALQAMQASIRDDSEKFFSGGLPVANIKVEWANLNKENYLGQTVPYPLRHYVIRIDRASNPVWRQARLTELHEECHVYQWETEAGGHGPKFDACMLMLAEKGAFKDLW